MRRIFDFAAGAGVALVGAYYWNTTHWSAKACEDVTHLERYYDPSVDVSPAERAAAGYALLVVRQFDCGENTEYLRRRAEKTMAGQ
jgi:hypothetical protein